MHIQIIAVFPEIFKALDYGIPGRAQKKGKLAIELLNLRDFSPAKHQRIDDKPYGGGPGMVLKAEPILLAINNALQKAPPNTLVSYLSPHGKPFNQPSAYQLSQRSHLIFVAGRYEGVDERVYAMHPNEVWSLGDFVLSGGEPAILCMVDAISRLIPGVLGNIQSAEQDSFSSVNGLLDHPHYTRPAIINSIPVPPILLSGHHQAIAQWRRDAALRYTREYRSDLLPPKSS
jgi:tRNA (guanine37-N1)-methyltransferase